MPLEKSIPEASEAGGIRAVGPRVPSVGVAIGAESHVGKVRDGNEDQFLVAQLAKSIRIWKTSLDGDSTRFSDEEGYLMIVADGMGGASAGEHASALAVRTVEDFMLDALKWFHHLPGHEEHALLGELRQALEDADREVIRRARAEPGLRGMGTTLTMAYSVGVDLYLVHAGDSRAYLFREGKLDRMTSDHTLVQALVDGGALTPEAARVHPRRNVVTNVIGGPRPGVHAEIHKADIRDGDVVLLCTDGLTGPVSDAEIARILAEHDAPDDAARALVEAALAGGAPDNVTVVVARYRTDG